MWHVFHNFGTRGMPYTHQHCYNNSNNHAARPVRGGGHLGPILWQVCRVVAWLSFAGWLGGHIYSFLGTWSKYQLQYNRKYIPYIESNCGDSNFHQVTMGLNHCDAFLEAIAIPSWERALFEEIQKLPVCSDGKCDNVVSGITNNKTWLCSCFIVLLASSLAMLRIKWYLEQQIRNNLPLDNPSEYMENTVHAPSYVDTEGRSWAVQVNTGLRHRINNSYSNNDDDDNKQHHSNNISVITPCDRYSDVTL